MLAARAVLSPFFRLEMINRTAQIIKSVQPQICIIDSSSLFFSAKISDTSAIIIPYCGRIVYTA